ncbi:rhomboid-like protein 20 isoform X2 [Rhodamnia argentea]|uniref:Rhomboid-like protein 20 isoform X2 n=1 Tax=Rhodamnia argentea TaxID=178133 RepID=A0ABM3HQA9_9MYRT|nr:rhomboid-like protein 20 isoform X2 [Rhodamnia argentea]
MMNVGPSGFNNAPASRAFIVASGVFTVFFGIRNRADMLGVSYQDIFQKMQMWKLIPAIFAFSSTPELIFGLYLLYYFRIFERQIGSNKFLVFILFSTIVSMALQVLALAVFNVPSSNLVSSGPYAVIFASFVPFFFDIPVSTRFRVLRISFSDKSFIYLASLQLLFSSWRRSFLPGICGILAGSLYRLNVFRIRKAKDFLWEVHVLHQLGMSWGVFQLLRVTSETLLRCLPLQSHRRNLLQPLFQWASTGILLDKRLHRLEMTSIQRQTSFLKLSLTNCL